MIDDMTLDDVPEVLAIERRSFATPWTEENFRHEIGANPVAVNRVLRVEGVVAGYVSAYVVADELQINDIAVAPGMRRRGFGRQLLDDVMAIAREREVDSRKFFWNRSLNSSARSPSPIAGSA